jgi:tripartite-type tricarboxylate transporter receptor subunit TctC
MHISKVKRPGVGVPTTYLIRTVGVGTGSIVTLCLALVLWTAPAVQAQAPFYQGKTITIIIGIPPGGVSDLWVRLYSRYMSKHIPGNPNIIVQNMPGAGSLVAANHIYKLAKPDGLTLGAFQAGLYLDQLLGRKEAQYDWSKFIWIGSPEETSEMLYMRSDSRYKTLEDIRKAAEPAKCGNTGTGTIGYYFPKLLEEALGLRFSIVSGYPGATDIDLAVEKGEVHCRAATIGAFFGREPGRTWAKTGFVRILVQGGLKRDARISDVPTIWELMEKQNTPAVVRGLAKVLLATGKFGRPLVVSPGVASDRVKTLRDAWSKALREPELLAEVKKAGMDLSAVSGEELQVLAKEVIDQPPEVIERLKKFGF